MPNSIYRHGAQHLKKRAKRKSITFKHTYNRRKPPPFAEIVEYYGAYMSRGGRLQFPLPNQPHYHVLVHMPSRYHLLYSSHRAPFRTYLSVTYDPQDIAYFRTKQAAINAAWKVYHQDEEYQAYVSQMER